MKEEDDFWQRVEDFYRRHPDQGDDLPGLEEFLAGLLEKLEEGEREHTSNR